MTATSLPSSTASRLRWFNLGVGLLHLVQATAMWVLSNDLTLPITASFLPDDPVAVRGPVTPEVLFEVPVGPAVALFLLLAAIDHLAVAGPVRRPYERMLAAGRNDVRWLEYSVSASLMVVLIGLFAGVWNVGAVIAVAGANAAMIGFGFLMERHQRPGPDADMSAWWLGTVAGLVPWAVITVQLLGGDARPPTFVYVIFVVELVLFVLFGLTQWLQYRQVGRWADYLTGERTYIVLSLVAKSLLAWLIFANVLRT